MISPWISVEERLPDTGREVLVCLEHLETPGFYILGIDFYQNHPRKEWYSGSPDNYKITHWQELPSLPNAEID